MSAPSFLALLEVHRALEETFARHQEALLDRDLPAAKAALAEFDRAIREHIHLEDEELLPVFRERCGKIPGGGPELFVEEHRKIERFLDEFSTALERDVLSKRETLSLLDREATFKSLLRHHDLRERNVLYPELDRVTSPEERARILADRPFARR